MKKLCELVDIAINNENCVVFQGKEGARMDLIALGCFQGNEDMIRMTKGRSPEITLFYKDGSNQSYHFGEGSSTVLSPSMGDQRRMIRDCCILDFGLVCDWSHMPNDIDYGRLVKETSGIRDMQDARRIISLNSGGGFNCNIRVNEQTVAINVNVKDVPDWFRERGFQSCFAGGVEAPDRLPCGNTYGIFKPLDSTLERDADFLRKKALDFIRDNPELARAIFEAVKLDNYREDIISVLDQKNEFIELSEEDIERLVNDFSVQLSCNEPYWDGYFEAADQVVDLFVKERANAIESDSLDTVVSRAEGAREQQGKSTDKDKDEVMRDFRER